MKEFISLLKNELLKTGKRPRTFLGFGVITFICLMLQLAFKHDGKEIISFITQQIENTFTIEGNLLNGNLVCFIILQTLIVQMPLLVALVTADSISGEASAGTLRFLLTKPASRTKVILAKWLAGLFYTLLLLLWLGVLALFVSRIFFGQSDMLSLSSDTLTFLKENDMNWRFMGALAIAFLSLSVVATLGLFLSVIMDNSITPIVSVMAIIIIFTIIGLFDIPSFDIIKPYLFTTHMISWRNMFDDPVPVKDIIQSCGILVTHIIVLLCAAIYLFNKKDITT